MGSDPLAGRLTMFFLIELTIGPVNYVFLIELTMVQDKLMETTCLVRRKVLLLLTGQRILMAHLQNERVYWLVNYSSSLFLYKFKQPV